MNRTNLIFMARANGFEVIQWLLRQAPPASFCVETLSHVSDLGNSLPDAELQAQEAYEQGQRQKQQERERQGQVI